MGTLHVPEHTGLLGALTDHNLAPGFNDAGVDVKAGSLEHCILHAVAVGAEVMERLKDFRFPDWMGAGAAFDGGNEPIDFSGLAPIASSPGGSSLGGFVRIGETVDLVDVFVGVIQVEDACCAGEVHAAHFPDPGRSVAQDDDLLGTAQVLLLDEVPFEELPAVYAAANVKVIASDYESFCFAALEAMATGLPVLTTDCAWVPRLVADGAGMVVPVGDAEAFAAGLKKLADNAALRQRMGAAGRDLVLARHTWPASAEKLLALYRQLI